MDLVDQASRDVGAADGALRIFELLAANITTAFVPATVEYDANVSLQAYAAVIGSIDLELT